MGPLVSFVIIYTSLIVLPAITQPLRLIFFVSNKKIKENSHCTHQSHRRNGPKDTYRYRVEPG